MIECVYDPTGTIVATKTCTDTGCQQCGPTVDLTACGDGAALGPDQCSTADGGSPDSG